MQFSWKFLMGRKCLLSYLVCRIMSQHKEMRIRLDRMGSIFMSTGLVKLASRKILFSKQGSIGIRIINIMDIILELFLFYFLIRGMQDCAFLHIGSGLRLLS